MTEQAKPDRAELTKRAWAKRRLRQAVSELTSWLGRRPKRVILWEEDYDRIAEKDRPKDVELARGPPRPPPTAEVSKLKRFKS